MGFEDRTPLYGFLLSIALVGAAVGTGLYCRDRAYAGGTVALEGAVRAGDAALVLIDAVHYDGPDARTVRRLALFDVGTGKLRLRRVVGPSPIRCVEAAAARMWCRAGSGGPLELRDVGTLAVVATPGKLIDQNPTLVRAIAGAAPADERIPVDSAGAALLVGPDGAAFALDPATLVARPAAEGYSPGRRRDAPAGEALYFDGRGRQRLLRGGQPIGKDLHFVAPAFATDDAGRRVRLADPDSVLIAHQGAQGRGDHRLLVTRVSLAGEARWTLTEPDGRLEHALPAGDRVILVTTAAVIAVRAGDGRVLWRYELK